MSADFEFASGVSVDLQDQVAHWFDTQFRGGVSIRAARLLHLNPTELSGYAQTLICAISLILVLRQSLARPPLTRIQVLDLVSEALLKRGIVDYKVAAWSGYEDLLNNPQGECQIWVVDSSGTTMLVHVARQGNTVVLTSPVVITQLPGR